MRALPRTSRARRAGLTLLEVIIAAAIFSVLMVTATLNVHRDGQALRSLARRTHLESKAHEMLENIQARLEFAQGTTPQAWLQADLNAGETNTIEVDSTAGFPDAGTLLLQPGTANVERIDYVNLNPLGTQFLTLSRGVQCTDGSGHDDGTLARWAGMAEAIEDQIAPPASFFDGVSQEMFGQVFYRGDGYGFSFRVPTDPSGNMEFFDGTGAIQWGATVNDTPLLTGWSAVYFDPVALVSEAARGFDLNEDGDTLDSFDLGRIRLRTWDTAAPDTFTDFVLCPPMILQEQCNWGGDLDNDGFQDPMFLWDPGSGRLRIRLFLLVSTQIEVPEVRTVEHAMFLRNGSNS